VSIQSIGLGDDERLYCSIADWVRITGVSRSVTYELLGTGRIKAIKLGNKTLIMCDHCRPRRSPPAVTGARARPKRRRDDRGRDRRDARQCAPRGPQLALHVPGTRREQFDAARRAPRVDP